MLIICFLPYISDLSSTGGNLISPACPHCNAPEYEITHVTKGSETRRYEDSPAVQKKPQIRLDLKTVPISPLKIGDSYEVSVALHPARLHPPPLTPSSPRDAAAVHDAEDGDLRSVRHQHRLLPGHTAVALHGRGRKPALSSQLLPSSPRGRSPPASVAGSAAAGAGTAARSPPTPTHPIGRIQATPIPLSPPPLPDRPRPSTRRGAPRAPPAAASRPPTHARPTPPADPPAGVEPAPLRTPRRPAAARADGPCGADADPRPPAAAAAAAAAAGSPGRPAAGRRPPPIPRTPVAPPPAGGP